MENEGSRTETEGTKERLERPYSIKERDFVREVTILREMPATETTKPVTECSQNTKKPECRRIKGN